MTELDPHLVLQSGIFHDLSQLAINGMIPLGSHVAQNASLAWPAPVSHAYPGSFFFPALKGWHCLRGPAGPPSLLFCTPMQRGAMPTGAASETGHLLRFPTVFPSFAGGVLLRPVLSPFVKHVVLVMSNMYLESKNHIWCTYHISRCLTPSHKFLMFSFK